MPLPEPQRPPPPPPPPLSPTSVARLGVFNEQMLLAAAQQQAEQQGRLQTQQQQAAELPAQPQPQPLLPLPPAPVQQPVVDVPAGLPPVSLASAASAASLTGGNGHSPFAALANGIAAASSSPFGAARRLSLDGSLAGLR